jgi:hypothetical protein
MNILVNIMDYPPKDLFYKIAGNSSFPKEFYNYLDDVPHHISTSNQVILRTGIYL